MLSSGTSWFTRFQESKGDSFNFHSAQDAEAERKRLREINEWTAETMNYIRASNGGQLIAEAKAIFVVESETISLEKDESIDKNDQRYINMLVRLGVGIQSELISLKSVDLRCSKCTVF